MVIPTSGKGQKNIIEELVNYQPIKGLAF